MARKSQAMQAGIAGAVCVGLLMTAPEAAADGSQPSWAPRAEASSADLSKQAQQLFDEGLAAERAGRWEKARTFLLSTWRLQHHWKVAAHLGSVEHRLGKMRDAAEHLTFLLREAPRMDTDDRRQTEKMVAQARAKVGAVVVSVSPPGAEVWMDEELVGKAPLPGALFVKPGAHGMEVRAEGYVAVARTVMADAGHEEHVEVGLLAVPKAPAAVRAPEAGEGKKGPNKAVVIAGGVAAGVGLGLGLGLMGASFAKAGERDSALQALPATGVCRVHHYQCPASLVGLDQARGDLANGAVYSLVVAGGVGAATLIYTLATRRTPDATGPQAAAVVGPGGGGVWVTVPW